MLDRTMSANKLCGNVAQTHFTIQTAVAYLASLLFKRKQSLIVYGAAERKNDYYNYFVSLGVQNCKLLTEDFLQSSSNNQLSLDIVSVLATPPNTNTGVTDPVQLVCSKGGDLTLLRAVASLDYTEESSDIPCMLDQRDTLRMAMSKPQVQIVVYETHSRLELENGGMVKAVVEEMNGWAYEKHNMDNYSSVSAEDSNKFSTSVETPWRPAVFHPVQIPDKDRFETMILYPDKTIENMEKNHVTGSLYLAAVKRVELMTFDANHLIRMAEQRGLFGKPVKGRKQKILSPIILLSLTNSDEPRVMLKFEQMHVLTPTHAFLQRCANKTLQCPRFDKPYDKTSVAVRWWRISIRHVIKALRKPFFAWTKVKMVRFGKRTNRIPLRLKKVTTSFKPQKIKRIYSCSYICL
ncbi:uncharacterized protein LOC113554698 [Rhopalosiphum maidis]|uniref:uncharacterized protein LOC113554698 n=1 Tax=Rhopalosiphum maidis TaxID=43146 RepID=UPI000EFF89D4|nr:uncharacterized protein LOC113554698 [Rhopalosiphum maidis]